MLIQITFHWVEYAITTQKNKQNAVSLSAKMESVHSAKLGYFSMVVHANSHSSSDVSVKLEINASIVHQIFT